MDAVSEQQHELPRRHDGANTPPGEQEDGRPLNSAAESGSTSPYGLVLLAAWTCLGCAMAHVHTSRQLEGGEVLGSLAVDTGIASSVYPSFRHGGAVTLGVGGLGDVSGHLGTGLLFNYDFGLTARAYLSAKLTASLQVYGSLYVSNEYELGWVMIPGLSTATTPERPWYGGLHVWMPVAGQPLYPDGGHRLLLALGREIVREGGDSYQVQFTMWPIVFWHETGRFGTDFGGYPFATPIMVTLSGYLKLADAP